MKKLSHGAGNKLIEMLNVLFASEIIDTDITEKHQQRKGCQKLGVTFGGKNDWKRTRKFLECWLHSVLTFKKFIMLYTFDLSNYIYIIINNNHIIIIILLHFWFDWLYILLSY